MTRDIYCQGEGIIIVKPPRILGYKGEVGYNVSLTINSNHNIATYLKPANIIIMYC